MTSQKRTPVETFDRLIDWDTSLTPRDQFFDAVTGDEQLRIKYGADITASTLHLGHGVNLRTMREMQDMGHKVVFLLGGFTTLVGDPTDQLQTRKSVDTGSIEENKKNFIDQVGTILNFDDPDLIEVRDNLEWWGDMPQIDMFKLLSTVSLKKLMSRDMFRKRMEQDVPIKMSEFLYPVLQGYDSVKIASDITVVGSDQLFNEAMGREFQKDAGQTPQMIVCTKITPGLDGGPKQSKSIGNYVGLSHSPQEKYARLMRLRDDLTGPWLRVYSDLPLSEIEDLEKEYAGDPLTLKGRLALNVTAMFHGKETAEMAREEFAKKMNRQAPSEIPEVRIERGESLRDLLMSLGHKAGAIKQLIDNRSVAIVENADTNPSETVPTHETIRQPITPGAVIRVGKNKYYRAVSNDTTAQ